MSTRRQAGDVVYYKDFSEYAVLMEEDTDDMFPCVLDCGDEECVEWINIMMLPGKTRAFAEVAAANENYKGAEFHVSECKFADTGSSTGFASLIEDALREIHTLMVKEGDKYESIEVTGTHDSVSLHQDVGEDFGLEDAMAWKSDVQKVGMLWTKRISLVRKEEYGIRRQHFAYDATLHDNGKLEYVFFLSPFDMLYYLENYASRPLLPARIEDGWELAFTSEIQGAIPVGATLEFKHGRLKVCAVPEEASESVLHRPVVLFKDSLEKLEETESDSRWKVEQDYAGILLLSPIKDVA